VKNDKYLLKIYFVLSIQDDSENKPFSLISEMKKFPEQLATP